MSTDRRLVRGAAGLPEHAPAPSSTTPAPTPGPGEVLVEVEVGLLGPEDLRGEPGPTLGREAVGIVVQVGPQVDDWHPGDRVALAAHLPCDVCPACRSGRSTVCPHARVPGREVDGWLAPRVRAPAHAVFHVPAELESAQAASIPGAVATAYHALKRAGVGPDVAVAVVGEDAVAAHAVQLVALAGGQAVAFDPRASGREHALDLGAERALDPALTPDPAAAVHAEFGEGVERVVLTPTGAWSAADVLRALRPGGRLVVVDTAGDGSAVSAASTVPVAALVADDLDVVGSRTATAQDVRELFDLADDGRLVLGTTIAGEHPHDDLDALTAALADPLVVRVAVRLR